MVGTVIEIINQKHYKTCLNEALEVVNEKLPYGYEVEVRNITPYKLVEWVRENQFDDENKLPELFKDWSYYYGFRYKKNYYAITGRAFEGTISIERHEENDE